MSALPPLETDVGTLLGLLLGALQGVSEWLPVSSEGLVSAVYSAFREGSFDDAVAFALWLHVGTVFSAMIALRAEVTGVLREAVSGWRAPSPLFKALLVATLVSAVIGLPLLIALGEISDRVGASLMMVVGLLMLVTGALQLRRAEAGARERNDLSTGDAVLAGIAQGLAVLPGLSRSGLTVAVLLGRRLERREALVFSFLMSIPASLGAALYVGLDSGLALSGSAIAGAVVAAAVGLATIRGLLAVAARVNFGVFVLLVGAAILAGGIWEAAA